MVMCGYVLARRFQGGGVTVNALHPGITATDIVGDIAPPLAQPFLGLVKRFLLTPEQGAASTVRLASAPELENVTGKYFVRAAVRREGAEDRCGEQGVRQRLTDQQVRFHLGEQRGAGLGAHFRRAARAAAGRGRGSHRRRVKQGTSGGRVRCGPGLM